MDRNPSTEAEAEIKILAKKVAESCGKKVDGEEG